MDKNILGQIIATAFYANIIDASEYLMLVEYFIDTVDHWSRVEDDITDFAPHNIEQRYGIEL
jgi:hypothetical protein